MLVGPQVSVVLVVAWAYVSLDELYYSYFPTHTLPSIFSDLCKLRLLWSTGLCQRLVIWAVLILYSSIVYSLCFMNSILCV